MNVIEQWNIPRPLGVCAATGKAFSPGEICWAAVVIQDGLFVRREYSDAAWNDALRKQAFSFWRVKVPDPEEPPVRRLVDDEVLLEFFRRLEGSAEPDQVNFRYVLGLLLVRRKVFKLADIEHSGDAEYLVLKEKGADALHRVLAPTLTPDAMNAVRQQVTQILNLEGEGGEAAPAPAGEKEGMKAEGELRGEVR
jgi:hypothetical protein